MYLQSCVKMKINQKMVTSCQLQITRI